MTGAATCPRHKLPDASGVVSWGLRLAHGGMGLVLVCAPGRVARAVGGRHNGCLAPVVAALGARHLVEAVVVGQRSRRWAAAAAGVDALHAASMLVLGAARPALRRVALVDGAVAATLAGVELTEVLIAVPAGDGRVNACDGAGTQADRGGVVAVGNR